MFDCPLCPGGYYCTNPLKKDNCPENTLAPPGSHDLAACICQPGYKCAFENVIHAEVVLPVTIESFQEIRDDYIAAVAAAAGVDPSQVVIISITSTDTGEGRRLLKSMHLTEVHTSIYKTKNNVKTLKSLQALDQFLKPHGLYAVSKNVKVHKEVTSSTKI